MKIRICLKKFLLVIVVLLCFLVIGCGSDDNPSDKKTKEKNIKIILTWQTTNQPTQPWQPQATQGVLKRKEMRLQFCSPWGKMLSCATVHFTLYNHF